MSQTGQTDSQRSDSIGRIVLQTVAEKRHATLAVRLIYGSGLWSIG